MKRGSVSLYVIIGILLLAVMSLFAFNFQKPILQEGTSIEKTNTKYYVDTCLDHTTTGAIEQYGFSSPELIAGYIDNNMLECVGNFSFIEDYEVRFGSPSSSVIINEDIVFVDLNFPLRINKDGSRVEISEFQYSLKRLTSYKIDNIIRQGTTFFSNDGNLVATAVEDTEAIGLDGNPADVISFNLLEKNFDGLSNGVVLGNIVYEGLPEGISFEPALKISIRLKKEELPAGYPKQSPMIGFYDRQADVWRSYQPIGFDEDDDYFYYSAEVEHFTPMAVVKCGSSGSEFESSPQDNVPMGLVYMSPIVPIDNNYWRENKEEGYHMIPEVMGNATCTKYESMEYNFEEDCEDYIQDWDEDADESYMVGEACYADCMLQAQNYLNCYYFGESCDLAPVESFAVDPGWLFDPFEYLDEEKVFADGAEVGCLPDEQCNIGPEHFYTTEVKDARISTTSETDTRLFSTPETYGYPDDGAVGGSGEFVISLKNDGDSCIDEWGIAESKTGDFKTIEEEEVGICSNQDECIWSLDNEKLAAGDNILIVEVENKESHAAFASGYLHFKGEGLNIESTLINSVPSGLGATELLGLGGGAGGFYDMAAGDFQEIFTGIELKKVDSSVNAEINIPRHVIYYVVIVDLDSNPGFFVTPRQGSLMTTSRFMAEYGEQNNLVLAINGGGFEYGGGNENIGGFAASSGDVYSAAQYKAQDATFVVSSEGEVGFGGSVDPYHAVTGFQSVVLNGNVVARFYPGAAEYKEGYGVADPRTSIGINKADNKIIIIVADGRGESQGLTLAELGELHVHHGANHAVNMDGGGSTSLVISQGGTPMVVNTPSDPGGERAVANHLGISVEGGSSSGNLGLGGGGEGIPNFAEVIPGQLARGGQPSLEGLQMLKDMGYTTIVDTSTAEISWEQQAAQELGMEYIALPLGIYSSASALSGPASNAADYLAGKQPVFVHCQHGAHRTGIAVALYRMKYQGWSAEQAKSEMMQYAYGYWPADYEFFFDVLG